METTTKSQQLSSGQTLATLTATWQQGSGWLLRRWDSWKGQEASETKLSEATWRSTEKEALQDMDKLAAEMKLQGWS